MKSSTKKAGKKSASKAPAALTRKQLAYQLLQEYNAKPRDPKTPALGWNDFLRHADQQLTKAVVVAPVTALPAAENSPEIAEGVKRNLALQQSEATPPEESAPPAEPTTETPALA